jgi:hypothetical protein
MNVPRPWTISLTYIGTLEHLAVFIIKVHVVSLCVGSVNGLKAGYLIG